MCLYFPSPKSYTHKSRGREPQWVQVRKRRDGRVVSRDIMRRDEVDRYEVRLTYLTYLPVFLLLLSWSAGIDKYQGPRSQTQIQTRDTASCCSRHHREKSNQ